MERLTIPDVRIDEKTQKRTIICADKVSSYVMEFYWRLKKIEDILGDDYDLDRLRELVEADREGRCYITSVKIGDRIFVPDKEGKIISTRVQGISLPVHGNDLILHLGGYPAEYLWSDREGIDWWKSREAAEAALKGGAYGG